MLTDLAAIGMRLVTAIDKQCREAGWLGAEGPVMFERAARVVRQALHLKRKFMAEDRVTAQHRADAVVRRDAAAERARMRAQKAELERMAEDAIATAEERRAEAASQPGAADADPADPSDATRHDHENLMRDLYERLSDPDIEAELDNRSFADILHGMARDLGIVPPNETWSDKKVLAVLRHAAASLHDEPPPPSGAQGETAPDGSGPGDGSAQAEPPRRKGLSMAPPFHRLLAEMARRKALE
jgi:hypothetical protein